MKVCTGIQCCLDELPKPLSDGAPFGLLLNQASVDDQLRLASELLRQRGTNLQCLFAPQHGIFGTEQANMIETDHAIDEATGKPLYSLYSDTRKPTTEMLSGLEWFVVDLQDVGTRVYTYIWTVVNCLEACAETGTKVMILDRPNPIGGTIIEGPLLEPNFESFVGMTEIPMRHGLTLGELAQYCNDRLNIRADLTVVPMRGWSRRMHFADTGLPWVLPSPNMPRLATAFVYPGQVLLEGTNLSEGRGTTIPFEVVGAPFIDARQLASRLASEFTSFGLTLRPTSFIPTFDKWKGETCHGVAWHWNDDDAVRSYAATLTLLTAVKQLWPDDLQWLPPPYEYEFEKPPIDILTGSDRFRLWCDAQQESTPQVPYELRELNHDEWWSSVGPYLLYD